jgi:ABC-type antimicrobial peptide transport system permease subunit
MRNALERRRELALQQAVGFGPRHLAWTILAENTRLLLGGIFSGGACALLAILPALLERAVTFPWLFLLATLLAILGTGLVASLAAVALVLRMPMLQALRSE